VGSIENICSVKILINGVVDEIRGVNVLSLCLSSRIYNVHVQVSIVICQLKSYVLLC
jgi:hypothetical protein